MTAWPAVLITAEHDDLADDVRRVFEELDRQAGRVGGIVTGQCTPPLDVLETDETVEIAVDLPGIRPADVRVVLKGAVVLVAGEKPSSAAPEPGGADYHLLERGSGRFARAVRLAVPFDGSRARAHLVNGELRVVVPRIHDRRGRPRTVPVASDPAGSR